MKLLIVDDCVDIVNILASFLELSAYEVDKATDGIEAVELLRNNFYNVVITDAEMPRMDGMELCEFIKTEFPAIYIIGMSGSFQALDKLKDAGADICFSKPFHVVEIERAIENMLPDSNVTAEINDSCRLY
ncbi:MAG: response regulator transcription factor [Smithellaceae bacterium]